ncbi:MAG: hypothetical protein Q8L48_05920 [Archangium sp.]|nr:hypothetical protein [Archangium sp.]
MSDRFPVWVSVTRDDGRVEQVRVGSAVKTGEGFTVAFDAMVIGATPMSAAPRAAAAARPAASAGRPAPAGASDGMLLPNYGRSKGMPVVGASVQDLEFYANGSRRSLADPSKARWHDKEKQLLAAIEAEIARQRGEDPPPPSSDDGPPPPGDEDAPF